MQQTQSAALLYMLADSSSALDSCGFEPQYAKWQQAWARTSRISSKLSQTLCGFFS